MSVQSTSFSRAVAQDQPSGGTLAHHEDVTPEPAAAVRTSLQKVKTELDTVDKTLTPIFEAVGFRQNPSSSIESCFVTGYYKLLRFIPGYQKSLETLEQDLSRYETEIERVTKLACVLTEDSELALCVPKCEWYKVRLQRFRDATSKVLALVKEPQFRQALKDCYDIAYECGITWQATTSLKEKAEKLKALCDKATLSIKQQQENPVRPGPEVQAAITNVQLDTLKSLKQLHDTIKTASPDGQAATITTTLIPIEKKRADCVTQITPIGVQNPPALFTDAEIKSYTPPVSLVGAMYFDKGLYAKLIKNPSVITVTSGNELYEIAKAIDRLRREVLGSIKGVCRAAAVSKETMDGYQKYCFTLYHIIDTLEAKLLADATNYLSQYVLDYAAGLRTVLKRVENDLQHLAILNNPIYQQMHDVQAAVFDFLQPKIQTAKVELLYKAATLRDKAKSTFKGPPADEGEIRYRAKIDNFHEVLAAKSKAALALTTSQEKIPCRLFGHESFTVEGKLHDDVRLYLEKEIMKFLYRPDKAAPMVLNTLLELLLRLVRTHSMYTQLFRSVLVDHPLFKALVDAYDQEVGASRVPDALLDAVNELEHFLYRASSRDGQDPIVHFARGWQRFVQLDLRKSPHIKKFIADELQQVCDTCGYSAVSEQDVDKKLQVTAQRKDFKSTLETSISITLEDKQSTLFRALACAIESSPTKNRDEYEAAQKVIESYTEGGKIDDYIEGHEDHFYTLLYENTIQKIMRGRLDEVKKEEKQLLIQGPLQSYLSAFNHDGSVDVIESAGRLDRVLFRLVGVAIVEGDKDLIEKIIHERFKGNGDRYGEWVEECMAYEGAVESR